MGIFEKYYPRGSKIYILGRAYKIGFFDKIKTPKIDDLKPSLVEYLTIDNDFNIDDVRTDGYTDFKSIRLYSPLGDDEKLHVLLHEINHIIARRLDLCVDTSDYKNRLKKYKINSAETVIDGFAEGYWDVLINNPDLLKMIEEIRDFYYEN